MTPALYIHHYRLAMRAAGNAVSRRSVREGFLLRCGDGFGCVQPWPELGDPAVGELLDMLKSGRTHRLLQRTLSCAARDGAARRDGRTLFDPARPIPRSHATVTGAADFAALQAAGFTIVKLKTHGADAGIVERVRAAIAAGLRVRIDCNGTGITALHALRPFVEHIDFIEDPEPYTASRWRGIRDELGMPLALDRLAGKEEGGYDVRVLKPALETCEPRGVPVVFTSYMDHPLGQMFAAWEASHYEGEQLDAGLLTHLLFEPDAFTEAVKRNGPQLLPAGGTGLGFDDLLEALPWQRLHAAGPSAGRLLTNPRAPLDNPPQSLPEGCLVFATSGSTGAPSLICLSHNALRANAAAVNARVQATANDVWLRVLPEFHVGGMSIHFRAELTGSRVVVDEGKWDPQHFVSMVQEYGVTLTSLVPAQVFDLVTAGLLAPPSLRAVFVGGGRLEPALYVRARAQEWPLLPGFGMTEAASQVALAPMESLREPPPADDPPLELLPCWEARVDNDGRLQLRGAPLLSGRLIREGDGWQFQRAVDDDGWFTTSDRVRREGRTLTPLGRCDRVVKILGEPVDLDALEAALQRAGLPPDRGVVLAIPDERAGVRPWLITDLENAEALMHAANAALPPFARIAGWRRMELPRSPLGKIQRSAIKVP